MYQGAAADLAADIAQDAMITAYRRWAGLARRTGRSKIRSAASTMPCMMVVPPVSTTPLAIRSPKPASRNPRMADFLQVVPFTPDMLVQVQDFHYGDEPFQNDLADWMCHDAIRSLGMGTKIWLYVNALPDIVGYSSLGVTRWEKSGAMGGQYDHLAAVERL